MVVLLEPGSSVPCSQCHNFILWYNLTVWSKYVILQSIFILLLQSNRICHLGVSCSEFSSAFSFQPWNMYVCLKVGPSPIVYFQIPFFSLSLSFPSPFLFEQIHLERAERARRIGWGILVLVLFFIHIQVWIISLASLPRLPPPSFKLSKP